MGDAYADIPKQGGDFAKAISVCINSGQCETERRGVMCPSFRVSDDPNLSTGGRIRSLKAVLNGDSGDLLSDQSLAASMDLCVACKGCKRECENEVDMAMMKVEYLAQRNAVKRPSLRTRLLAGLPKQLNRFPWLRTLVDIRNHSTLLRQLGERVIGISAKRSLPVPRKRSFLQNFPGQPHVQTTDPSHEVVLLVDSFTNRFCPENADAAVEVLKRAGYRVFIAHPSPNDPEPTRPLCCGRTYIANGMIEQARAEARRMTDALAEYIRAGRTLIGLEPACLLAIRDDYLFLGLGETARTTSVKALLFEEFIAREIGAKRFQLDLKPIDANDSPVLIHGHCHQKAVGAMKSMRKVLKVIPGLDFHMIESSCCGMAGSFGIEAEHAETGMEMAELSLLPTVRKHPNSRIIANGFSCRHQIEEGSGRSSIHLAQLLHEASG